MRPARQIHPHPFSPFHNPPAAFAGDASRDVVAREAAGASVQPS